MHYFLLWSVLTLLVADCGAVNGEAQVLRNETISIAPSPTPTEPTNLEKSGHLGSGNNTSKSTTNSSGVSIMILEEVIETPATNRSVRRVGPSSLKSLPGMAEVSKLIKVALGSTDALQALLEIAEALETIMRASDTLESVPGAAKGLIDVFESIETIYRIPGVSSIIKLLPGAESTLVALMDASEALKVILNAAKALKDLPGAKNTLRAALKAVTTMKTMTGFMQPLNKIPSLLGEDSDDGEDEEEGSPSRQAGKVLTNAFRTGSKVANAASQTVSSTGKLLDMFTGSGRDYPPVHSSSKRKSRQMDSGIFDSLPNLIEQFAGLINNGRDRFQAKNDDDNSEGGYK